MTARIPWVLLPLLLCLAGCNPNEIPTESCSADEFCPNGFVCHPVAQLCVPECVAGSDCPVSARDCAVLDGHPGTGPFCQCQSTELCAEEEEGTLCSPTDRICTRPCRNDVDCTHGRTCDVDAGVCV